MLGRRLRVLAIGAAVTLVAIGAMPDVAHDDSGQASAAVITQPQPGVLGLPVSPVPLTLRGRTVSQVRNGLVAWYNNTCRLTMSPGQFKDMFDALPQTYPGYDNAAYNALPSPDHVGKFALGVTMLRKIGNRLDVIVPSCIEPNQEPVSKVEIGKIDADMSDNIRAAMRANGCAGMDHEHFVYRSSFVVRNQHLFNNSRIQKPGGVALGFRGFEVRLLGGNGEIFNISRIKKSIWAPWCKRRIDSNRLPKDSTMVDKATGLDIQR